MLRRATAQQRKFFDNQTLDYPSPVPRAELGGRLSRHRDGSLHDIVLIDLDTNRCGTYTWSVAHPIASNLL